MHVHTMVKLKNSKEEIMALPGAYVVNSPELGEYCNNCVHYSNNYCIKFYKEVAPYGWCCMARNK